MERPFRDSSRQIGMVHALRPSTFPDVFEDVLVPAIFERYARDLVERARPFGPSDRVLDLGCGTGIVARVLRERLGGGAPITGLDVNPAMIAKATALAPALDWRVGTAVDLPFADRSFDVALAQQVLQFVPDRALAARELRRVLAPGGRVVISTWRPRACQPLHDALGLLAERHFGASNDKRWSLDGDELRALLVDAGFVEVSLDMVSLSERYLAMAPETLRATVAAGGFDLAALSDVERERRMATLVAEAPGVLAPFAVDEGYTARSITNVVTGRVP